MGSCRRKLGIARGLRPGGNPLRMHKCLMKQDAQLGRVARGLRGLLPCDDPVLVLFVAPTVDQCLDDREVVGVDSPRLKERFALSRNQTYGTAVEVHLLELELLNELLHRHLLPEAAVARPLEGYSASALSGCNCDASQIAQETFHVALQGLDAHALFQPTAPQVDALPNAPRLSLIHLSEPTTPY